MRTIYDKTYKIVLSRHLMVHNDLLSKTLIV